MVTEKTDEIKICTRCVMDTTVPNIVFDRNGVCNICKKYDQRASNEIHWDSSGRKELEKIIKKIKEQGKGKKFDCICGLSGGLDSTMALYRACELGLRPLVVHLDNGWNSELAVSNIEKIIKHLGLELYTYVLDWEEFRDIQISFLKASIPNAEIPTDHAIVALLFKVACKKNIKYIISGGNVVTEAAGAWMYDAVDCRFLKNVQHRFGTVKIRNLPTLGLLQLGYYAFVKRIKYFTILNYVPYNKAEDKKLMENLIGWKDYGGKHHESIYTRFFESYILPVKFNIDKRKAHLSNLINAKQITREEAMQELERPVYSYNQLKFDREYVIKKLGLSALDFDNIMSLPIKSHNDYPNNEKLFYKIRKALTYGKKLVKIGV